MKMDILILSYSIPIFCFVSFYMGFKTAKTIYLKGDLPNLNIDTKRIKPLFKPESEKQEVKAKIYRANIENFGTGVPQREVK